MSYQKRTIPTLDGWRALSIIGVILYHGRVGFFGEDSFLTRLAFRGDVGVDVFFAISGFLICGLLLREYEASDGISLSHFYIRRCFRILPPCYTYLLVLALLGLWGVLTINFSDFSSCLLFYRNFRPLGMVETGGFYTAHLWSLAVEEHFYLLFPLLLLVATPKRIGKAALFLALALFCWRMVEVRYQFLGRFFPPQFMLARTDMRMDGLLWGCLAAIYFPQIKLRLERIKFNQLWFPILLLLPIPLLLHADALHLLLVILLPALVLSTVLQPASLLGRFLESAPVRWIGTLSYSLYLWQELFLPQVPSIMAHGAFRHLQQWPWNVPAILVCACLSRYLVEIPMNRTGHRLGQPRRPVRILKPRVLGSQPAMRVVFHRTGILRANGNPGPQRQ
ncbi:MAG TPA: acyltransferase [Acidobacteriaceae bacterium]|nr:acyltransferase [Acidobacteriaceae bacterium]